MLHQKIIDAIPQVKKKMGEKLVKYAGPNPVDKFRLVAMPEILNEFMDIAGEMTVDELCEDDWWVKGFPYRPYATSQTLRHEELERLSYKIAEDIYESAKQV